MPSVILLLLSLSSLKMVVDKSSYCSWSKEAVFNTQQYWYLFAFMKSLLRDSSHLSAVSILIANLGKG